MCEESTQNIIETALTAAKKPFIDFAPNGTPIIFRPEENGEWTYDLNDDLRSMPERKSGVVSLDELDSFISFTQLHKEEGTQIYISADFSRGYIKTTAIINGDTATNAGWKDHRALYEAKRTPQAQKWLGNSGKAVDQGEFSVILTELIKDIVSKHPTDSSVQYPTAAEVLDFCANLEYTEKTTFKRGYREQDGRTNFTFVTEDTKSEKNIKAFEKFGIAFTPFVGGDSYFIEALLKFRVDKNNGALVLWYELQNVSGIIEQAARDIAKRLQTELTGIPVYFGLAPSKD